MSSTPGNNPAKSVKWTKVEVDVFVDVMVEEVKKGNKTTSTFNKAGWNSIKSKLESHFGRTFTTLQLRNKMSKLRNDYGSFKKLLETFGFNWNVDIRACEITDESVWGRHIKENPAWLKFKRNGLLRWLELQIIFGDSYASGVGTVGNAQEHNIYEDVLDLDAGQDRNQPSPGVDHSDTKHLNEGMGTRRIDRTHGEKRKKGMSTEPVGTIREICDVSSAKLELVNTSIASSSTVAGGKDYSVSNCISILDSMTELDKELYMNVIMKIIENPTWREAFVSVPAEKRMWLIEELE